MVTDHIHTINDWTLERHGVHLYSAPVILKCEWCCAVVGSHLILIPSPSLSAQCIIRLGFVCSHISRPHLGHPHEVQDSQLIHDSVFNAMKKDIFSMLASVLGVTGTGNS